MQKRKNIEDSLKTQTLHKTNTLIGLHQTIDDEELIVLWLTILKILDAVPRPKIASFYGWKASIVDHPEPHRATKLRG